MTPLNVDVQRDAFLADLDILETHVSASTANLNAPPPEEVVVQGLSVHVIPTYLIAGSDFFDAYWDALRRMLQATVQTKLEVRFVPGMRDVPHKPNPDPQFLTTQMAALVRRNAALFKVAERDPTFAAQVQRFQVPSPRVHG